MQGWSLILNVSWSLAIHICQCVSNSHNFCLSEIQSGGWGQNPPTKNEGATVNYVKFLGGGGDVKSF